MMDAIATAQGRFAMTGIFEGEAVLHEKLSGQFGYVKWNCSKTR